MQVQRVQNNNYGTYDIKQAHNQSFCARTIMGGTGKFIEDSAIKQKSNSLIDTIDNFFKNIIENLIKNNKA